MKFIDFFGGIGGGRRGLELSGNECVGFCEFDKFAFCSYVSMHTMTDEQRQYIYSLSDYRKRQKEILANKETYLNGEWYAQDVKEVQAKDLPQSDCWIFGAPCQDFSISGRREGLKGERSSLVMEIIRLLEESETGHKPRWIIYENVKGMLSSNRGWDFALILAEMAKHGYGLEYCLLNSANFSVPQKRERVYTVGRFGGGG